jgi:hypothetical protein
VVPLNHTRTPSATAQGIRLLLLSTAAVAHHRALQDCWLDRLFKPLLMLLSLLFPLLLLLLVHAHLKKMSAFSTSSAVQGRIT